MGLAHNVVTLIFLLQACKAPQNVDSSTRSCLDLLKKGVKTNGYYQIFDQANDRFITVYCDMNSEQGAAWTLVLSFALKNKDIDQIRKQPLGTNAPVNEHSPNWNVYRMSLLQMRSIKSQSSHWRVTCSFPTHGVDYTDYARANFADYDPMTFLGKAVCKRMEFINIRGHQCVQCTATWWQELKTYQAHIDSQYPKCQLVASPGSVSSEDNFGLYDFVSKKFRCTASPDSTTNWWFGGYF